MRRVLLLLICLYCPVQSMAATHYIRDGGTASTTGTGSCNSGGSGSWATANACDNLPSTLVRGDTYYIADGSYGSRSWTTLKSGSTLITIKKATSGDHGTDTGWDNAYGDGQAVWTTWDFLTSPNTGYWVFDGQSRTAETAGHGFRVGSLGQCNDELITLAWAASGGTDHVTFRYLEVVGEGYDTGAVNTCVDRGFYTNGASAETSDITIQYSHIHDVAVPFLTRANCHDWTVEYNWIADNYSSPASHAETWSDNSCDDIIFRFNTVLNSEGTAALAFLNNGTSSNWEIYGNVFAQRNYTCGTGHNCGVSGIIFCANDASNNNFCDGFKFFNNTIDNYDDGVSAGRLFFEDIAGVTAPIARNNIWHSNSNGATHLNVTLSHNWYYGTTHNAESNEETGIGDPFVDAAGLDWHLTGATSAGSATDNPTGNTVDSSGVTRSIDGVWDRGAYEYCASGCGGGSSGGSHPSGIKKMSPMINLRRGS